MFLIDIVKKHAINKEKGDYIMPTVHRVHYFESERGWGSDQWQTDYTTEEEAQKMVKETNEKFCSSVITPDYYIKAEYLGPINL